MTSIEEQARSVFLAAVGRDPESWPALLDEACQDNAELRDRVKRLLAAHEMMGSIHGGGGRCATLDESSRPESIGNVIGPYKLIELIGEGGMGTVWMAQQTEPVKRLVALKLIKPGMDSKQVIARFGVERQALALMDHPNIAKVLDAGATDAGRPYFVMDLVKGVPITKYCDEHHLTPRQRLELFISICHAIQHAHHKGIVHRDLKPSNVLIALYDGQPVPKVIDFGVAKAAGQPLTEQTLVTSFGAIVGTLEYMSPEQAEFNQLDIDTRSDVYSLGVLLYELLTGTTPLEHKRVKETGLLEALRIIREEEVPTLSKRLSSTAELPAIAANRGTEPAKLAKLVRGELDWIVRKALEKDRNRRYETANSFAADVQRYLSDEAVQACPPSAAYRLKKFLRRSRKTVIAAALVLLALLGGVAGTTTAMLRAIDAEGQAVEASGKKDLAILDRDHALEQLGNEERRTKVQYCSFLIDGALAACESGEVPQGLLLLARALDVVPPEADHLERVIRVNLAAWSRQTSQLRGTVRGNVRCAFAPDGKTFLAYCADDRAKGPTEARLRDSTTLEPIGQTLRMNGPVKSAVFTPDGSALITGTAEEICKWDPSTGKPLGEPLRFPGEYLIRIGTDGQLAATVAHKPPDQSMVRFWNVASGKPIGMPILHPEADPVVLFSPDHSMAITLGYRQSLLWDVATSQSLPKPSRSLLLGFATDGKLVACQRIQETSGEFDGERYVIPKFTFDLWDPREQRVVRSAPWTRDDGLNASLRFGDCWLDRAYFAGNPSYSRMFQKYGETVRHEPPRPQRASPVDLKPGAMAILVQDEHGRGRLWRSEDEQPIGATLSKEHMEDWPTLDPTLQRYFTFHRDVVSNRLAPTAYARLWNIGPGGPFPKRLRLPHPESDTTVLLSPDLRHVLTGFVVRGARGERGGFRLEYGERTGAKLADLTHPGSASRLNLAGGTTTSDGRLILAVERGSVFRTILFAVTEQTLTTRWEGYGEAVAFAPDGDSFVEGGAPFGTNYDRWRSRAQVWDARTGDPLTGELPHAAAVNAVAFSPDGRVLVTGCGDMDRQFDARGEAHRWDAKTGSPLGEPWQHPAAVTAVACDPNGLWLATGCMDGGVRLWDVKTTQLVRTFSHRGPVLRIVFGKDGLTLLTASSDHTVRLWDLNTGKQLGPAIENDHREFKLRFLAFEPDAEAVITLDRDGGARRWAMTMSPVEGSPERINVWVEVLTGLELDAAGAMRQLSPEIWELRRERLIKLGGPPMP